MFNRLLKTIAAACAVSLLGASTAPAADKVKAGTSGLALLWTFIETGAKAGTWQNTESKWSGWRLPATP